MGGKTLRQWLYVVVVDHVVCFVVVYCVVYFVSVYSVVYFVAH